VTVLNIFGLLYWGFSECPATGIGSDIQRRSPRLWPAVWSPHCAGEQQVLFENTARAMGDARGDQSAPHRQLDY